MTLTDDDLRRLIELADRVGPWVDDVNIHINAPECVMRSQQERWDTEIEFARAARNALPDIATELLAQREQVRQGVSATIGDALNSGDGSYRP